MRLQRLHLLAYGAFTGRCLEFDAAPGALVLVHGENEAGKSTILNAMTDLRFGFELKSEANFLHPYAKLQVGGVFIDEAGEQHAVVRRKGKNNTLMQADFSSSTPMSDTPAALQVQRGLTQGFDRKAYLRTFALDRDRMMQGGQELFRAEGDIGALLFEASTGAGSLSEIQSRLESEARKLYSASAQTKNAVINQALAQHRQHKSSYATAGVLPSEWKRLNRAHEEAQDAWHALLNRQKQLNADLQQLQELRSVLPQLRQLTFERDLLQTLDAVPLLEATAAADLSGYRSGLQELTLQMNEAQQSIDAQRRRLDSLQADDAVLTLRQSVQRVVSTTDALSLRGSELADAGLALAAAEEQLEHMARSIDPTRSSTQLLQSIPARTTRTDINRRLQSLTEQETALRNHDRDALSLAAEAEGCIDELPPLDRRTAFETARTEALRQADRLRRLAELPRELKHARRELQQGLKDIGIDDASLLEAVRMLGDSLIDDEVDRRNRLRARFEQLTAERATLDRDAAGERATLAALLEQGELATRDDVRRAREQRDVHWRRLRTQCLDALIVTPGADERGQLADIYGTLVERADEQADSLAGDSARAASVQQSQHSLKELGHRVALVEQQFQALEQERTQQQASWEAQLTQRCLPNLSGMALRDWQAEFRLTRSKAEYVQSLMDEQAALELQAAALAIRLREAIDGLGLLPASDEQALPTLLDLSDSIEATLKAREKALQEHTGRQAERRQAIIRSAEAGKKLRQAAADAQEAVLPVFDKLLLPASSSVAMARERLDEFEELDECQRLLLQARQRRDKVALEHDKMLHDISQLKSALQIGDELDPLLFCEHLQIRLQQAEVIESQRIDAQRRIEQAAAGLASAERQSRAHGDSIAQLCKAASVSDSEELPEKIAASDTRRAALHRLNQAQQRLRESSTKTEAQLRELLAERDEAQLDVYIDTSRRELAEIDASLEQARLTLGETKQSLDRLTGSAEAADAAAGMQQAVSTISAHLPAWIRLRLADSLLQDATSLFREKAQAPMFERASSYFRRITDGEFTSLGSVDDGKGPTLSVTRRDGEAVRVAGLSEGTRDQLYLSLRLAAVDLRRRSGLDLPLILDDVLMSSDEKRTALTLNALAEHAGDNQVILLTHHRHVVELAELHVPAGRLVKVCL